MSLHKCLPAIWKVNLPCNCQIHLLKALYGFSGNPKKEAVLVGKITDNNFVGPNAGDPKDKRNTRILHSGAKAPDKGCSRSHGLKDPVCVLSLAPIFQAHNGPQRYAQSPYVKCGSGFINPEDMDLQHRF